MREILFRVWDMVENCYLPEDVYCILNKTEFGAFGKMIKDWRDYREGEYFYDDSQILEQFTGLTDKNGKKIFEGDIIKYTEHSRYLLKSFIAAVSYKEYLASFAYLKLGLDENGWEQPLIHFFNEIDEFEEDMLPYIEIIDNIHDNQELLKEL